MIDPEILVLITITLLLILLFIGVHIAVSLCVVSLVGVYLITGRPDVAVSVLYQASWVSIRQYMFGVIPMYILMGLLANMSGASLELYDAANLILKRVRGGVSVATILANALFSAFSGVAVASAVVFTKIALPQMQRLKYDRKFSLGVIAGSASMGFLIPPSLLMIVYGSQANTSIGSLFLAGIVPGLIMTVAFIITVWLITRRHPSYVPPVEPLTEEEKKNFWKIVLKPWAIVALIFLSLGGIWFGFFTPTEAGGVGAFGAFVIVILKGKFTLNGIWEVMLSVAATSGSIMILMIAAQTYSRTLAMGGVINFVGSFVSGFDLPPIAIVLMLMFVLLLVSFVMDATTTMLLTIPLMVPIVTDLGFDLVWFGIIMIIVAGTGLITPPFGMNVFAVKAATLGMEGTESITLEEVFGGSFPFFLVSLVVLAICIFFPQVVLFLPGLM